MRIFVTGGLGFIGSHTVVELQNEGFEVVVIDNLSNACYPVLDGIAAITGTRPAFEQTELRDKNSVRQLFGKYPDVRCVIHFAASKGVGESVQNPLLYYENNLNPLTYLLQELQARQEPKLIFSSSCTVYGQADQMPITEEAGLMSSFSPYANTKRIGEEIIADTTKSSALAAISLRYFNPVGAHPSALIGEMPKGRPGNLVPFITQAAIGLYNEVTVFGNDYNTPDGTCIRDYIHVTDLAKAHVTAMKRLILGKQLQAMEIFNLGVGKGHSVLEVITAFEKVTGQNINYRIVARREGDVARAWADTSRANRILGWSAKLSLEDALASAWAWEQRARKQEIFQ